MTIPLKYLAGFDCLKDDFKACISIINTEQKVIVKASRAYNNTVKGFNDAESWVLKNRKEKISVVGFVAAILLSGTFCLHKKRISATIETN